LDISFVFSEDDDMQQYYPSLDFLKSLVELRQLNIKGNYALERIHPLVFYLSLKN
jgi:hypothetical protein